MPKIPEAALMAAQTYLYTTQPNPEDPREHMHRAALQRLRLVGNKLTAKEEEAYRNKRYAQTQITTPSQQSLVLKQQDLGHHHQNTTKAQGTEEPKDPGLPAQHTITKTMKKRWEHHALIEEFAPPLCPKDSNSPMISKSMTDLRNHSHGSQIIHKQSKY
jgi:hypothetical protein